MDIQVTWFGVVLAAASAMVIGWAWYSPMLFGKQWMKIVGLSEKEMKKNMNSGMGLLVGASLVTAYILDHFINYAQHFNGGSFISAGFQTALWVWLGFGLTTIVAHGALEPRDKQIMYINAGNRLVTLLAMGLIIGSFLD